MKRGFDLKEKEKERRREGQGKIEPWSIGRDTADSTLIHMHKTTHFHNANSTTSQHAP